MVIFNLYNKLLQSPRRNDFTLTMIKQSLTTSLNKSSNSSQTPLSIVAKPNRFMSRSSSSRRTTEVTLSLLCLLDCMAAGAEHKDLPGNTQPRASALLPLSTFLQQSNKGFFFFSPWDRNSLPGEGSRRQRDLIAGCLPPVSIPTKSLPCRSRPRLHGNQDRGESPCFSVK